MREVTQGQIARQRTCGGFRITETIHPATLRLHSHDHENPNINIVLEGSLEERVEHRTYTCLPGSMLFKPAGARHSNRYGDRLSRCLIVEVKTDACRYEPLPRAVLFERHPLDPALPRLLQRELMQPDAASALIVEGLALQLLGLLHRQGNRAQGKMPRWLLVAREMLIASTSQPCTLAQLAAAVGVDRTHLAKTFRRHFHLSPGEYLRRHRILTAAALLRTADRRLSDIAAECGFADQSHFSRVFQAQMRLSPARYRRLWRTQTHQNPAMIQDRSGIPP